MSNVNNTDKEEEGIGTSPMPVRKRRGPRNRRRGDIEGMGVPPWLISFTDIMALMLTFFVLLYAMSEPEEKSWSEVMAALQKEFHVYYGPRLEAGPNDVVDLQRVNFSRALPLDYLQSLLERQMAEANTQQQLTFNMLEDRLVISLPDEALFDAGLVQMKEDATRQLYKLGNALSRIRNRIEIIGHSDPTPITNPTSEFPSNWELSLERAASVAAILKRTGYTQPVIVKGESSVHYDDLNEEFSEDVRAEYSRRVDIHIMPDDGRSTIEKRLKLE